jgi:hypothetical protein
MGQITAQGLNNLALLHNGAGCGVAYQHERDRLALHQCAHRSPGFRWKPLVPEAQSCQGGRVERLLLKRPKIAGDVADHPGSRAAQRLYLWRIQREPVADRAALLAQLRYAAGVEIAAMREYLTAARSLRPAEDQPEAAARRPQGRVPRAAAHRGTKVGTVGPVLLRAATQAAIDDFIGLEAPSQLVDELYGRILATLQMTLGTEEPEQTVRTVTACGNSRSPTSPSTGRRSHDRRPIRPSARAHHDERACDRPAR